MGPKKWDNRSAVGRLVLTWFRMVRVGTGRALSRGMKTTQTETLNDASDRFANWKRERRNETARYRRALRRHGIDIAGRSTRHLQRSYDWDPVLDRVIDLRVGL